MKLLLMVLILVAAITTTDGRIIREMKDENSDNLKNAVAVASVNEEVEEDCSAGTTIAPKFPSTYKILTIDIANDGPMVWQSLPSYFYRGASDQRLPDKISSGEKLVYTAQQIHASHRTGIVGVFCFYIPEEKKTLGILFFGSTSSGYSNKWNARVYNGTVNANYNTYASLYSYSNKIAGDDEYHSKEIGYGYSVKGRMLSSGTALLQMAITKQSTQVS